MSPFFEKWRAALADQKAAIAWEQASCHGICELLPVPGDDPTNVLAMASAYTEVFQKLTSEEITDAIAWLRALRQAAADQCKMLELQCGDSI